MQKFRDAVNARGARGMIGMSRQFKIMDDNNNKKLEWIEFDKACKDFRVNVTENERRRLFQQFDVDGNGTVSFDEFIREVRGPMNEIRTNIVNRAFDKMDRDGNGVLEINDLKGVYNASRHPDVLSGKKTENEIFGEFLETFEQHLSMREHRAKDRKVSRDEFKEYYCNISCSVDRDEYFVAIIKSAWKMDEYASPVKKSWGTENTKQAVKEGYGRPQMQPHVAGSTNAPYATLHNRDPDRKVNLLSGGKTAEDYVNLFREKLKSRGARGILGLQRLFKIMDDD